MPVMMARDLGLGIRHGLGGYRLAGVSDVPGMLQVHACPGHGCPDPIEDQDRRQGQP